MRNKQRMSQAQAAQNAKAIAQARTMAAEQTLSPTDLGAGTRNSNQGLSQRKNTDLPSATSQSSTSLPQQSRPLTQRDQATTDKSHPSLILAQQSKRDSQSRDQSLQQLPSSVGLSASLQLSKALGTPPPQMTGAVQAPMSRLPRSAFNNNNGGHPQPTLNRSTSEVVQDEQYLLQGLFKGRTINNTTSLNKMLLGELQPANLTANPKGQTQMAMYPKGRHRVKSLQGQVPPLQSLAATKGQQQPVAQGTKPLQRKKSITNQHIVKQQDSGLLSQSVGSRGGLGSALNNTEQSTSTFKNGETHIKLLVRIRPTLNTESAVQCIQLQKAVQRGADHSPGLPAGSSPLLSRDASHSLSRKKGPLAKAKGNRLAETLKPAAATKVLPSPSIIKLTKGYNNISFKFDQVLPEGCSQDQSFQLSSAQIVKNFVTMGSSATIFAYGQTGAGKTFTIMGGNQQASRRKDGGRANAQKKLRLSTSNSKGILPRVIDNLFVSPENPKVTQDIQFIMSFYEIYNDKVYDLLKPPTFSPQNSNSGGSKDGTAGQIYRESLDVREKRDGNFAIHNLKKVMVNTRQESYIWLEKGLQNRQICATSQNVASSRSHTIFQIEMVNPQSEAGQTSKLRIVDLAGSEKYCYSNNSQDVKMKELSSINQSLSTLGQCISALGNPQRRHIPFRNCKLTKILKDSLMQPSDSPMQTIVALIVCISPSVDSYQETQSTLQFADRAKKAILNQGPMQMMPSSQNSSAKMSSTLLDMASEMEKLRRENAELKSHLQGMKQSSSQGSLQMLPPESSSLGHSQHQTPGLKAPTGGGNGSYQQPQPVRESIDLRLAEILKEDSQVIMEVQDGSESALKVYRPRQDFSPPPEFDRGEDQAEPLVQLRSCFKGARAQVSIQTHQATMQSRVAFNRRLDNDDSLNESIRERIEHNLKYNDDTIFDNLEIFQDIATNNKVHGAKDKFDAKKLLGTPIDEIPVSEDEEEEKEDFQQDEQLEFKASYNQQNDAESKSPVESMPAQKEQSRSRKESPLVKEKQASYDKGERTQQAQIRIRMSTGDMQGFENTSPQMQSFSQSNIQAQNSFMPDMPSLNEVPLIQDTLNLSNDLSNDLIELGNDKQFQNAFNKGHHGQPSKKAKQEIFRENAGGETSPSPQRLIHDDFLKFDDNEKHEDSLPLSNSLAFGDQPGNLSSILEQSNPFSKRTTNQDFERVSERLQTDDMFKPQDKLFLNDMSNIMRVDEALTQRSLDPASSVNQTSVILQGGDHQLQQTLILDAEEEKEEIHRNQLEQRRNIASGTGKQSDGNDDDEDDTIAGLAMMDSCASGGKQAGHRGDDLRCNVSADNMISFDASRISPSNANNLDTSNAHMNNVEQLVGSLQTWPSKFKDGEEVSLAGQRDGQEAHEDLNEPGDRHLLQPQVESSKPMNLLQDMHTSGSLFGRNHKKLAMQDGMAAGAAEKGRNQLGQPQLNNDEILTFSLTNTFSTIQSLGGELNALRNNLEMNQNKYLNQRGQRLGSGSSGAASLMQSAQIMQQLSKSNSQADRMSKAPVSGSRGAMSQSSNMPLAEARQRDGFIFSKRLLGVRRSQERLNTAKAVAPSSPLLNVKPAKKKKTPLQNQEAQQRPIPGATGISQTNSTAVHHLLPKSRSDVPRQGLKKTQLSELLGHQQPQVSKIVPGNRIDQIREAADEDAEENSSTEIMTDQSLSLDLTTFARDLQGYYSKIHSEIAQLKEILLKTQHEQKQALRFSDEMQAQYSQDSRAQQPRYAAVRSSLAASEQSDRAPGQHLPTSTALQSKLSNQQSPQQPQHSGHPKQINKDAILRAQELIEQIKTEIMNGFSSKQQPYEEDEQVIVGTPRGLGRRQQPFDRFDAEHRYDYFHEGEDRLGQYSPMPIQTSIQQNSGHRRSRDTPASSVMTFHPTQQISEPTLSEIEPLSTTQMQLAAALMDEQMARQRNMSSQNVVSLLQRLQNELLESIPPEKRSQANSTNQLRDQRMAMSAKKLVQKRLDLHPQFEEIEGSQERSPYVVRHMQVQRQNYLKVEDTKTMHAGQKLFQGQLSAISSGGNPGDIEVQDQFILQLKATEPAKKNLEDSTEVNLTNTSAVMFGDRSHVIQRPLPVNRVQQKITKDRTYGIEQQHRAPRSSPERPGLLDEISSAQEQIRSLSRGKQAIGQSASKDKQRQHQQVQGPKITGVGTGSVAADHTLTLIFDSDEEMVTENNEAGSNVERVTQANEQKRLSEIVEDYLDEGNLSPRGHDGKANSHRSANMLNDVDNSQLMTDFGGIQQSSQPFAKALDASEQDQRPDERGSNESPPSHEDGDRGQHSFMQESSLQNLFPISSAKGTLAPLEGMNSGQSRISRREHGGSSSRTLQGLPQFSQCSDNNRFSELNIPIMQNQKQDMSHMSDDDLQFLLGSQGLNHPSSQADQQPPNPQFDLISPLLSGGGQPAQQNENKRSIIYPKIQGQSDRNIYEIKETDTAAKEVEHSSETQQPRKQVKPIAAAQQWVAPPRLKNLRSKKNKKGKAKQDAQPVFQARQTIFLGQGSQDSTDRHGNIDEPVEEAKLENVIGAQESTANDRHMRKELVDSDVMNSRPGSMASARLPNRPQVGIHQQQIHMSEAQQNSQQLNNKVQAHPLMAGSGTQAKNPQLTQTLHAPHLHQSSMDMQDMSRYSENFDEEDYQEQSNNSSSKHSVQKYFFQFFNPSAKLHLQQQQFKAQSAFRQSNSATLTTSQVASGFHPSSQPSAQTMPSGLAAGIPRSSGKKSPLTTASRRQPMPQQQADTGNVFDVAPSSDSKNNHH